jgi:hypothetical protein
MAVLCLRGNGPSIFLDREIGDIGPRRREAAASSINVLSPVADRIFRLT